jgi:hypothetical protein
MEYQVRRREACDAARRDELCDLSAAALEPRAALEACSLLCSLACPIRASLPPAAS